MGCGVLSPGVKRQVHETDHSSPTSAEVKKTYMCVCVCVCACVRACVRGFTLDDKTVVIVEITVCYNV
jgi:hypothetical protein